MNKKIKKFSEKYIKESNDSNMLKTFKLVIDMDKVVDKVSGEKNKIYKIEI